jgi:diadenosine tetraphosphatase ApaH/serine/threonine PP2A family protein phosphatase
MRAPGRSAPRRSPGWRRVGMPFDGDPRAAYALLHDDGTVERRRVSYPHGDAADAVRTRFAGGWTELVAQRIETARFDLDAA